MDPTQNDQNPIQTPPASVPNMAPAQEAMPMQQPPAPDYMAPAPQIVEQPAMQPIQPQPPMAPSPSYSANDQSVNFNEKPSNINMPAAEPTKKPKTRMVLIITLIVVLLAGAGLLLWLFVFNK